MLQLMVTLYTLIGARNIMATAHAHSLAGSLDAVDMYSASGAKLLAADTHHLQSIMVIGVASL